MSLRHGLGGWTLLNKAAHEGRFGELKCLLERPDIDVEAGTCNGYTALHFAADRGLVDYVEALLDAGADINAK